MADLLELCLKYPICEIFSFSFGQTALSMGLSRVGGAYFEGAGEGGLPWSHAPITFVLFPTLLTGSITRDVDVGTWVELCVG